MQSRHSSPAVLRGGMALSLAAALLLSLSACGETRACRAATGAALGAAGGALIGAVVAGSPGAGAVVGGVAGGAVGGLTSSHQISAGHNAPCH